MAILTAAYGSLVLNQDSVRHNDTRLNLTAYEFQVMRRLIETQAAGDRDVTTHWVLEDHLRGVFQPPLNQNIGATVMVMVSRLRKKLRDAGSEITIKSVRGVGYTLERNVKAAP